MIRNAASSPLLLAVPSGSSVTKSDRDTFKEITDEFFSSLRSSDDKKGTIVSCANGFCQSKKAFSMDNLDAIEETGEFADEGIRRARFGVSLLNEHGLTDVLEESMLESKERNLRKYTRYLPLLGSFNNCLEAACAVNEDRPETIEHFLIAVVAFGIEVCLWYVGAPFKMAWRGTRFVANRTFLRLAKHGCRTCVALAMSEIHWAIRGSVYSVDEIATEREYIVQKIAELQKFAQQIDYDVNIMMSEDEVKGLIDESSHKLDEIGGAGAPVVQERQGFFERLIPDLNLEFDINDLFDRYF